jgi:hypothetical protein
MALPRLFFVFPLLGLDSLEHIARLGDVRQIDFGRNGLGGVRRSSAALARRTVSALKMRTNLLCLKFFQRTGVGLAFGQADFRQYVQNPATLDFHLAREIVDTNLTHPPLFKMCFPKPTSRS